MILFEHKNFLFLFCGILINGYIFNIILSLFFEWPFRTMSRVVFSSPQRVLLRLKGELAKELNTAQVVEEEDFNYNVDNIEIKQRDMVEEITFDQAAQEFGGHITSNFSAAHQTSQVTRITRMEPSHPSEDFKSNNKISLDPR